MLLGSGSCWELLGSPHHRPSARNPSRKSKSDEFHPRKKCLKDAVVHDRLIAFVYFLQASTFAWNRQSFLCSRLTLSFRGQNCGGCCAHSCYESSLRRSNQLICRIPPCAFPRAECSDSPSSVKFLTACMQPYNFFRPYDRDVWAICITIQGCQRTGVFSPFLLCSCPHEAKPLLQLPRPCAFQK
jgi:hypothetical protein